MKYGLYILFELGMILVDVTCGRTLLQNFLSITCWMRGFQEDHLSDGVRSLGASKGKDVAAALSHG